MSKAKEFFRNLFKKTKSNDYETYLTKYGERPRYFQENQQKINFIPFLLVVGVVPLILTPQYINYWIMTERKHGDRKINI
jgi:hypothetical protein